MVTRERPHYDGLELSDTELEQEMRDLLYIYAFGVGKLSMLEGYSFI